MVESVDDSQVGKSIFLGGCHSSDPYKKGVSDHQGVGLFSLANFSSSTVYNNFSPQDNQGFPFL